ncbi:MAG: hypothetical protein ACKOZV_01515, partial [Bacteroidota bacterium]
MYRYFRELVQDSLTESKTAHFSPFFTFFQLELVQDSLTESKTAHFSPFFTFFQLRSTGYAPSKTQKLTKNQPVFAN